MARRRAGRLFQHLVCSGAWLPIWLQSSDVVHLGWCRSWWSLCFCTPGSLGLNGGLAASRVGWRRFNREGGMTGDESNGVFRSATGKCDCQWLLLHKFFFFFCFSVVEGVILKREIDGIQLWVVVLRWSCVSVWFILF